MKKINVVLLMLFFPLLSIAQSGKYSVKAEIANCQDGEVSLTIWKNGETLNGSTKIVGGKFTMTGESDVPQMVRASFETKEVYKYVKSGGYAPYKCSSLWFLIYPGADVSIKGTLSDFTDAYPTDKSENKILASLTKEIFPMMSEVGNIGVKIEDNEYSEAEIVKYSRISDSLNRRIMEIQNKFIRENSSSYAAIWFIDDMLLRRQLTPAQASEIIANVDPKYKSLDWFKGIEQRIMSVKYTIGATIPSFTTNSTVDGKTFSMESLKGKYVIIDFWGTWCGPCMSGMDGIRAFRDKYTGKIEILGIAKDSRQGWLDVIKSKNLNWLHILNGKGDDDFVAQFNVTGYPTKILISPKGEILYRESGESDSFYSKVEEFIK